MGRLCGSVGSWAGGGGTEKNHREEWRSEEREQRVATGRNEKGREKKKTKRKGQYNKFFFLDKHAV